MLNALIFILPIALVAMATVPVMMAALASVGLFEPIEFEFCGRAFRFAPKSFSRETIAGTTTQNYSASSPLAYAGIPAVLTVVAPLHFAFVSGATVQISPQIVRTASDTTIRSRDIELQGEHG
jgi:hypothetical protein